MIYGAVGFMVSPNSAPSMPFVVLIYSHKLGLRSLLDEVDDKNVRLELQRHACGKGVELNNNVWTTKTVFVFSLAIL